ncbi:site-specific integrase [Modicisalibacter xianhensis]|uniref:Tyr recombinase domain-containing protein n=1 Tax=Modicisalibacter xianhensis TaxID=442341 RepID=A0A1I2ZY63_9GAMM|nr:site-specific integrase [Halomonas xianhensis]SFH42576.1 protein of unknown function [Halomonas xianhensis]
MAENKQKLTAAALKQLAIELPSGGKVWDTDLAGYHVLAGKRGLAFRLYYRTKTGKQRVLTLGQYGILTAPQARANATEALAIVAQGGDPRAVLEEARAEAERQNQQTLRAYLTGPYTAFQNRRKDGKGTLTRIARDFPDWLDKPMGSLTRADVERWQAKEEAADKPRAFQTLKRSYDALQALLAHATDRNVIPTHPLKSIKLQKPALTEQELAEQGSERRYLETNEVEALFAGLEAYQDEKRQQRRNSREHGKAYLPDLEYVAYVDHVTPWILTMFYTGLRPGDLFGLRWEHVNLMFATIRKTIEKTAHKRPEPQTFPISGAAVEVLKTWHKQQGQPMTSFVFPSPRSGKRLDRTAMRKPWATVRKLAGLPEDLQLYTLRHNFASQLIMAGTDILTVSKLMAHSSIETTIKFYAHLAPDHKRDAVEAFAKLAPGQGSEIAAEEAGFNVRQA